VNRLSVLLGKDSILSRINASLKPLILYVLLINLIGILLLLDVSNVQVTIQSLIRNYFVVKAAQLGRSGTKTQKLVKFNVQLG